MVGLEELPAPLPLDCLYQLPDLKALDSARRSCSVFSAVQMQHLKERTFVYRHPISHLQTPEGVSYKLLALSPPSWVEQQRVMSALWRLQVRNKLDLARIPGNHESDSGQSDLDPWQSDLDVEVDLSLKDIGASLQHADHIDPPSWEALDTPPRSEVDSSAEDIAWRNTWEWASRTASSIPNAYTYFHAACRRRPYSPLQDADWSVLGTGYMGSPSYGGRA